VLNQAARHEDVLGEWRYSSMHSMISALDGGERSASRPDRLTPKERAPGTHWIGGWVGPGATFQKLFQSSTNSLISDLTLLRLLCNSGRHTSCGNFLTRKIINHYILYEDTIHTVSSGKLRRSRTTISTSTQDQLQRA